MNIRPVKLPEWSYEPCGDVDGDPAYDAQFGIDHFIYEQDDSALGSREIACLPDGQRAELAAAAPTMLRLIRGMLDPSIERAAEAAHEAETLADRLEMLFLA